MSVWVYVWVYVCEFVFVHSYFNLFACARRIFMSVGASEWDIGLFWYNLCCLDVCAFACLYVRACICVCAVNEYINMLLLVYACGSIMTEYATVIRIVGIFLTIPFISSLETVLSKLRK